MNISNDREIMVFEKEGKYTVGISKKINEGEYENAYFPIQFNKEVKIADKTKIKIKKAWLSFYKWVFEDKKGTTFFIKCSEFEITGETAKTKELKPSDFEPKKIENDPFADFGNSISIDDNFLD